MCNIAAVCLTIYSEDEGIISGSESGVLLSNTGIIRPHVLMTSIYFESSNLRG